MSRTSIGRTIAWALLALTAGGVLARAVRNEPALASRPDERRQIDDLYAIFKDEVSDSVAGNVYEALGNRFQLDGLAYNHLFNALNACDRLRATEAAADFAGKEASRVRQLEAARKSFQGVVENLPWPRFRIVVREAAVDLEAPRELRLDAGIGQPVLLAVSNERADPESVRVTLDGVPAGVSLEVAPRSTRYLLARIERGEAGPSRTEVLAAAVAGRVVRAVPIQTAPTGSLEGVLTDAAAGAPASARVRITTEGGRYLPPEKHTYGLILKMFGPEHDQIANRWFYADGKFRVRAPAGRVKVAIRKGLEFRSVDALVDVPAGGASTRTFALERWSDMARRGWHSADIHLHYFDPPSVRFEMAAEDVAVCNILVMNHRGAITARQYFTGALDAISDAGHLVYYNEEFRNGPLGHLGLLNLKRLVEPISTGSLGSPHPQFFRGAHFEALETGNSRIGDPASPDRLLVDAMRETHRQGGLVNWAHLRDELEFALDAALGQLDTVDILTDTEMPQTLTFWYSLLNCGFRIPATGGTDRAEAHIPIGHQRVYARLDPPFSYAQWIEAIRKGATFVTNAPMVELTVDGAGPGGEIMLDAPRPLRVRAAAESQLPFATLDVVVNGEVVRSEPAAGGRRARVELDLPVRGSVWIAARALGARHPEIMYYPHPGWSHPVVGHTSPVYVRYRNEPLAVAASARFLLERVRKLEAWVRDEAYFGDEARRREALAATAQGIEFYRRLAEH